MRIIQLKYKQFPQSINLTFLVRTLIDAGAVPMAVGGCVRDFLLNKKYKDIDLEIYGLTFKKLVKVLSSIGKVDLVGKSFGVLKVTVSHDSTKIETFDISMPRIDIKTGVGHNNFLIKYNSVLSLMKASLRRDFTINSIAYSFKSNALMDPHGGINDLRNRLLRHVSKAFVEDPLRVFRACQFAARFNFKIDESTLLLCRLLKDELNTLSKERIFEEFKKLLLSEHPSIGLALFIDTKVISLFPELFNLIGCLQEKKWHPEGDVWTHTLLVVDEAAKIAREDHLNVKESLILLFSALCHDLGKPIVTKIEKGYIRSKNHDIIGKIPTKSFLYSIGAPSDLINQVIPLVMNHLRPYQFFSVRHSLSVSAIKRLSLKVSIERLCRLSKADFLGRKTKNALSRNDLASRWLLKAANDISLAKQGPSPILLGRHIVKLGIKPGPYIGKLLRKAFFAQLSEKFNSVDSGILWIKKRYNL